MHNNLATRWVGHLRPYLSGLQATRVRYGGLATQYRGRALSNTQSFSRFPISKRQFSSLPSRQNHESPLQSSNTEAQPQEQPPKKQGTYKSWILFNIAGLSAVVIAAVVLRSASSSPDDKKPISKTSFRRFTIVSKEQVSPTAFVLSVRAAEGDAARAFREAWDHGLWSVEIKQPQLQIARRYTPLPPQSGADDGALLRFLIRSVDGGEMSTYLGKRRVGDAVWLRGPHLGFDVARRLGDAGRRVVFVAGGTGIAPALQVARRLLDGPGENVEGGDEKKPTVSILWANRRAADALGRQRHVNPASRGNGWWFPNRWQRGDEKQPNNIEQQAEVEESSFAQQIQDLERRHPGRFRVSYFVDEEGSFIRAQDLRTTLTEREYASSTSSQQPLPPAKTCTWHAPTALAKLPDDDDAGRRDMGCKCGPNNAQGGESSTKAGANLICVSGPDGFIEAYAGPKRWYAGTEMQGPMLGVLGRMLTDGDRAEVKGNWLVLKL
ncbi:hypothetical protein F4818DRAFT_424006 [Hypoxylon cercidicola]|nr:hypothetical protein F4818DRAFT_424006 [Hypoxylon cercidicola]